MKSKMISFTQDRAVCCEHWKNPFGKPQSAGEKLTRRLP